MGQRQEFVGVGAGGSQRAGGLLGASRSPRCSAPSSADSRAAASSSGNVCVGASGELVLRVLWIPGDGSSACPEQEGQLGSGGLLLVSRAAPGG